MASKFENLTKEIFLTDTFSRNIQKMFKNSHDNKGLLIKKTDSFEVKVEYSEPIATVLFNRENLVNCTVVINLKEDTVSVEHLEKLDPTLPVVGVLSDLASVLSVK